MAQNNLEPMNVQFRNWRLDRGITQPQLAKMIGIGRTSYVHFEQFGIGGARIMTKIKVFYSEHIAKEENK